MFKLNQTNSWETEYDCIAKDAADNDKVLGLLFFDIDYFKRLSEKYQLTSGRLGGEEFVLIDT